MPEGGVLGAILAAKAEEIGQLGRAPPTPPVGTGPRARRVVEVLSRARAPVGRGPLRLITEIKRRSPSAGALSTVLTVAERALAYARGGAAMISVLCDRRFFDGGWGDVEEARRALDAAGLAVPILAKEFIVDRRQLEEAAARGADAALLIARIVDAPELARLHADAVSLGLLPLVEVVTEEELSAALEAGAQLIGVNTRDLDTLVMDAARAARILASIPADRIAVHLSGLKGADDVAQVARSSAGAALIGEALMREDDPTRLLAAMVAAAG